MSVGANRKYRYWLTVGTGTVPKKGKLLDYKIFDFSQQTRRGKKGSKNRAGWAVGGARLESQRSHLGGRGKSVSEFKASQDYTEKPWGLEEGRRAGKNSMTSWLLFSFLVH